MRAIAARWRLKLPAHLEVSDLFQAGVIGLLDAASKYDPETHVSFSTYATHRIRGAILDSLRGQDPAPRKLRKRHRELESVRSELTQTFHRCPTEPEISERSGIDIATVRETFLDIHHLNQMSKPDCDSVRADQEQSHTDAAQPESIYEAKERAMLVNKLIGQLPESHRMVIVLHYTADQTLKEISGAFGVPERQVSRIHNRALVRINAMLRTRGITASTGL